MCGSTGALGHAAVNGRFGWKDLASILNAQPSPTRRATESRSLAQGTAGWAKITPPGDSHSGAVTP